MTSEHGMFSETDEIPFSVLLEQDEFVNAVCNL